MSKRGADVQITKDDPREGMSGGGETPQRASAQQLAMRNGSRGPSRSSQRIVHGSRFAQQKQTRTNTPQLQGVEQNQHGDSLMQDHNRIKELKRSDNSRRGQSRSSSPGAPAANPFSNDFNASTQPAQSTGFNFQASSGPAFGAQSQSFPSNAPSTSNASSFSFAPPATNSFPSFGSSAQTNNPSNFTGFSGSLFNAPAPQSSSTAQAGQPSPTFSFGSAQASQPAQSATAFSGFGQSSKSNGDFNLQSANSQPSTLFGQPVSQAPQQANLFGAQTTTQKDNPFGKSKSQTSNLFGDLQPSTSSPAPFNPFANLNSPTTSAPPSNLFGGQNNPTPTSTAQTSNLFGQLSKSDSTAPGSNPFSGLNFSQNKPGSFGVPTTSAAYEQPTSTAPVQTFNLFGAPTTAPPPPSGDSVDSPSPSSSAPNPFNNLTSQSTQKSNMFGSMSQSQEFTDSSSQNTFSFSGQFGHNSGVSTASSEPGTSDSLFGRVAKPAETSSKPAVEDVARNDVGNFNFTPDANVISETPQANKGKELFSEPNNEANEPFKLGQYKPMFSGEPPGWAKGDQPQTTTSTSSSSTSIFSADSPFGFSQPAASKPQANATSPLKGVLSKSSSNLDSSSISASENVPKKKVSFDTGHTASLTNQSGESTDGSTSESRDGPQPSFGFGASTTNHTPSISNSSGPILTAQSVSLAPQSSSTNKLPPSATLPPSPSTTSLIPKTVSSPSPVESLARPKIRVSSYGPESIPKNLDNDEKARYDVAARLRSLNESFQRQVAQVNPGKEDFASLLRYYAHVREQIGAPLGLFERATAGTKRRSEEQSHLEQTNSTNKRSRTDETFTPSSSVSVFSKTGQSTAPTGNLSTENMFAPGAAALKSSPATTSTSNANNKRKVSEDGQQNENAGPTQKRAKSPEKQRGRSPEKRQRAKSPEKQGSATSSLFKKLIDSPTSSNSSISPAAGPSESQSPFQFSFGSSSGAHTQGSTVPSTGFSPSKPITSSPSATPNLFGSKSTEVTPALSASQTTSVTDVLKFGATESTVPKPPTFKVPQFGSGGPVDFMGQFGQKAKETAAQMEKEAKEKRKAEDFDSDEDDEAEFDRKYEEEQRAKRARIAEMAKNPSGGFVPKIMSDGNALKPAAEFVPKAVSSWFPQSGGSTPSTTGGKSVFDTPVDHSNGDFGNPFSKADLDKANSDLAADQEGESDDNAYEEEEDEDYAEHHDEDDQNNDDQENERVDSAYKGDDAQMNGDHEVSGSDSEEDSIEAAIAKKRREAISKPESTPSSGRSLFHRIQPNPDLSANGSAKDEDNSRSNKPSTTPFGKQTASVGFSFGASSNTSASPAATSGNSLFGSTTPSNNPFGSTSGAPVNLFGTINKTPAKSSDSTTPSKPPGSGLFGTGFSTPNPPGTGLFVSGSNTPVNTGKDNSATPRGGLFSNLSPSDNTWKAHSPIKFGGSNAPPSVNITAASPSKNNTNGANPFTGLFGAISENKNNSPSSLGANPADVGFGFGGPPKSAASPLLSAQNLSAAPSILSSANTSRATSPGGTDADSTAGEPDEAQHDEQLSLIDNRAGEEEEDLLFEIRSKASEMVPDPKWDKSGPAPKVWTSRGVGPLRVLKHKTTGKVRLLLRHDPGARIVLNCHALKNIDYKVASGNSTVMFMVPVEAGKLQSWGLKVKTMTQAEELAKIINDNKA